MKCSVTAAVVVPGLTEHGKETVYRRSLVWSHQEVWSLRHWAVCVVWYSSTNGACVLQQKRCSDVINDMLWTGLLRLIWLFSVFFNRSQAYGFWKRSCFQPQAAHWWRWALNSSSLLLSLALFSCQPEAIPAVSQVSPKNSEMAL